MSILIGKKVTFIMASYRGGKLYNPNSMEQTVADENRALSEHQGEVIYEYIDDNCTKLIIEKEDGTLIRDVSPVAIIKIHTTW